ncbi:hypothetical protein [Chitinophaga niabensis]|uniref:Uncharacterized protein n=1 Tax=Chitinophaga niabensis TaxID=536979 RepID=A0A1N6E2D9_9BACT|nr:hypothetical protein [Chitinophaga niabensis]SIN77154.1 hypothetical protein SAMN04488055_1251 [Chitinophaga niabensis]
MGNLFTRMSDFANVDDNPAHQLYKMTIAFICTPGGVSDEELKTFQSEDPYRTLYNESAGKDKFLPEFQRSLPPTHIQWIRDAGLGIFLWEELEQWF